MPLLVTNERNIFFAHVPKTGGTSVEDYLIRRFGGPLTIIDQNHKKGVRCRGLISLATHLTAIDLVEFLPYDLDYCFTVVRDPIERMLSQYRYQLGVSRMSRFDFSTWLRIMLNCARLEPRIYQNHIRPQSDLVPEDAEVFRMEDGFDQLVARLDEVTNTEALGISVGHLLKRKRKNVKLWRQDVLLIEKFYAQDYERFGYELPTKSGLPSDPYAHFRKALARILAECVVHKQRRDWLR